MIHPSFPQFRFETGPHVILGMDRDVTRALLLQLKEHVEPAEFFEGFGAHLHPKHIALAMEKMWDKEYPVFLTTMNPFVLDCLYFKSDDDLQYRLIIFGSRGPFRNLTWDEARSFYISYQAGLQHVSEIIRSDRLW